MAAALLGAGVVAVFAAPDRVEHVRLDAGTPADAAAALAAADRWADSRTVLRQDGSAVLIDHTVPASLLALQPQDTSAEGSARDVARRAVDELRETASPTATPAAPLIDPMEPLRSARRAGLQARLDTAERDRAGLSVQLSEVVRAIAELQAAQVTAGGAATPGRALLAQLQARRIDLVARYTADFPAIAITDAEIAQLQAQIARDDARLPHPVAALATLDTERNRLTQALTEAQSSRDTLAGRIAALDAEAATAAATLPPTPVPLPAPAWSIRDLATTTAADYRPAELTVITVLAFGAWIRRRRTTRTTTGRGLDGSFSAHVGLVAAAVQLPVLRCLDLQGDPLVIKTVVSGRRLGPAGGADRRSPQQNHGSIEAPRMVARDGQHGHRQT